MSVNDFPVAVDFNLEGILEPVDAERPTPTEELLSDESSFCNYSGVEDDPQAMEIIEGTIDKGWLREFDSYDDLAAFVQGTPILNKFACMSKENWDPITGK